MISIRVSDWGSLMLSLITKGSLFILIRRNSKMLIWRSYSRITRNTKKILPLMWFNIEIIKDFRLLVDREHTHTPSIMKCKLRRGKNMNKYWQKWEKRWRINQMLTELLLLLLSQPMSKEILFWRTTKIRCFINWKERFSFGKILTTSQ